MLVPTSLVSLLAYHLIDHQAEQFVNERIHNSLYSINRQIDYSLSSAYEDSEWLSQLIFDSRSNGALPRDWSNMQEWLLLFLQKHDNYNYIVIKNGPSRELVARRSSHSIPGRETASSADSEDRVQLPLALPPLRNAEGQLETTVKAALPDGSGTVDIGLSLEGIAQRLISESNALGIRFMLTDGNGSVISDSSRTKPGTLLNDTAYNSMLDSAAEGSYVLARTGGKDAQLYYTTIASTGWKLSAEAPLSIARSAATPMLRSIAFIIALTMLIGVFVAALFMSRSLRPIRAYREAFIRMSEGDCSFTMPHASRDEWGRLGSSFNRMLRSLQRYAFSDPLTGLPDRRRMTFLIDRQLKNASEGTPAAAFAIWFIDIDNFKQVNDSQGHAYGDEVVRQVARELQRLMPPPGIVSRFGGDEFVILMPDTNELSLRAHATKLQERFDRGIPIHGETLRVQLSVGVALYPKDGETLEQLIGSADQAMYRAKRKGKNNIQFY